jgi:hypothetical protein
MNETAQIEQYILGKLSPEECLLFEATLLINDELAEKTVLQQRLHELVFFSGRKQLRKELAAIDRQVFLERKHTRFQRRIASIFR